MKIAGVGESLLIGLIRRLQDGASGAVGSSMTTGAGVLKGIGDDAAVLFTPPGGNLLASTDLLVEGVHFDLSTTTTFQLGYKCITVNLSDIRAMGGTPCYLLVSLGLPGELELEDFEEFVRGMTAAAGRYNVYIVGGDTCRSDKGFMVSVTVLGKSEKPVFRSGVLPGQELFVTGTLGDSALGLEILQRAGNVMDLKKIETMNLPEPLCEPSLRKYVARVLKRHLMPDPVMQDYLEATAMIDVSDGLLKDLAHLCQESGTGVRLEQDSLPLSDALLKLAPLLGFDSIELALRGGEDYELLFAAPAGFASTFKGATRIGEFVDGPSVMVYPDGSIKPLQPEGYDHFSGQSTCAGTDNAGTSVSKKL